jgi:two-component system response regulator
VNGKYILLVEDDPDDEELTRLAMREADVGNELRVVRDGAEALDFLFCEGAHEGRPGGDLPQVVLLDLNLPKVPGLSVLKRIREDPRTALLPVVVLTSSQAEDDVLRSYRHGANSFVRKPVDFDEFRVAAREIGVYWLLLNRLAGG